MLNAHFKSSGFNKNQRDERKRDLRVQIEQQIHPPPEVRDMKPGGGWFPWRCLLP
jgi:hypothetical protein